MTLRWSDGSGLVVVIALLLDLRRRIEVIKRVVERIGWSARGFRARASRRQRG